MAHDPMAITYFGLGICSYMRMSLSFACLVTPPVTTNMSACRGLPFTRMPNLSRSNLGAYDATNSMSQPLQDPELK